MSNSDEPAEQVCTTAIFSVAARDQSGCRNMPDCRPGWQHIEQGAFADDLVASRRHRLPLGTARAGWSTGHARVGGQGYRKESCTTLAYICTRLGHRGERFELRSGGNHSSSLHDLSRRPSPRPVTSTASRRALPVCLVLSMTSAAPEAHHDRYGADILRSGIERVRHGAEAILRTDAFSFPVEDLEVSKSDSSRSLSECSYCYDIH